MEIKADVSRCMCANLSHTMIAMPASVTAVPHHGRGKKSGQASGVRVSKANHSLSAGVYAVDFGACPEKLPRPSPCPHALSPDLPPYSRRMADLITAAYCSTIVPGTANVNAASLAAVISAVSDAVQRYCRRNFTPAAYTELYDSPNRPYLMLRQTPILLLNSVTLYPTGLYPLVCTPDQFDLRPEIGRISFKPQAAQSLAVPFPWRLGFRCLDAVEVNYIAGFGFATTSTLSVLPGEQIVTPAAIAGTNIDQPWAITAGATLVMDPGTVVQETVTVSAASGNTFTATFTQPHAAGAVICGVEIPADIAFATALATGNVFNQPDLTKQRESQGKTIGYEYLVRAGDLIFTTEITNILDRYRDAVV